jgi:putative ABC transport system permease protein
MGKSFNLKSLLRFTLNKPRFFLLITLLMSLGLMICFYMSAFIYTITDKPLPFAGGERVVLIGATLDAQYGIFDTLIQDFDEIRASNQSFEQIGAFRGDMVNIVKGPSSYRHSAIYTDLNAFALSAVKPVLGRLMTEQEAAVGATPVTVLSYEFWQTFFNGREDIIEKFIIIDGKDTKIVGVFPSGYHFPWAGDVYLPFRVDSAKVTRESFVTVAGYAQLASGVSLAKANIELQPIMARLAKQYPQTNTGVGIFVDTYAKAVLGKDGQIIVLMMSLIPFFIFMLLSINVGNLLFTKSMERILEVAIRISLGAPRKVVIMQMMLQGTLICLLSSLLALGLTYYFLGLTQVLLIELDPNLFIWQFALDQPTLLAALVILVVAISVTSFLPAWLATRQDFNHILREGTVGKRNRHANKLEQALVTTEIVISLTALTLACVLSLLVYRAANADIGVSAKNLVTAKISMPAASRGNTEQQTKFHYALVQNIKASLGVQDVAVLNSLPGSDSWPQQVIIEGKPTTNGQSRANTKLVIPGAVKALAISLLAGRYFEQQDLQTGHNIMVSKAMVDLHWPNESPIGKRLKITESDSPDQWWTVTGVMSDTVYGQAFSAARLPVVYFTRQKSDIGVMTLAIRSEENVQRAFDHLSAYLARAAPDVVVYQIQSYQSMLDSHTALMFIGSRVFVLFGLVSFVLAAGGIYSFVDKTVQSRSKEIGIRRAIGAGEGDIYRFFFKQRLVQLVVALASGLVLTLLLFWLTIDSQAISVISTLLIFFAVSTVIILMVMVATYIPVTRALKVQPTAVLRYQ